MRGWRAWYATSRTTWVVFSSGETVWEDIPPGDPDVPEGVVGVVAYRDPPYRQIIDGADWCWLEDGEFWHATTHEEWGRYVPAPEDVDPSLLKKCVGMDDEAWARVQAEMMAAREPPA